MPQSLSQLLVHVVFSTKERRAYLQDQVVRDEMHRFLGGISKRLACPPLCIGGVADHVHLLGGMARTITLADWIKELKRASSVWIKEKGPMWQEFHWQAGYGAFSVSQSQCERVAEYIRRQEEHHHQFGFQEELRRMLAKHQVPYDERYVWD